MVNEIIHRPPLGKSDHQVLLFDFFCYVDWSNPIEKYNFARGDFDAARNLLNNENLIISGDVENDWENLKQLILNARDQFVPKRVVGKRTWRGEYPPDSCTFRLLKEKEKAYRNWIHNHNTDQAN